MEKLTGKEIGEFYRHCPMAVAVITVHANGKDSGMSAAWVSPVSFSPPLFGVSIASKRHTHSMIVETGEFAVNFFTLEKAEIFAKFGGCSGKDTDKFGKFGVKARKGDTVRAPIIDGAYAVYECRLFDRKRFGDHDWFVGEILCIHRKEGAVTREGALDLESTAPSLYLGQETYATVQTDSARLLDRRKFARG
jgi:flavin reductase (DIM6/NTAB) family NADH-FMN oxidoreductase RutF